MRRLAVLLTLGGAVACADWAGPRLGRPSLAIVPVFPGSQATVPAGDVLLGDLDRLRVIVTELPARRLVADTSVGVDAAGNAQVTVPVHVIGSSPTLFEVSLEGIRTSDGTVLYSGIDTVAVTGGIPIPPVAVLVIYVGPCQLGAGCRVTLGPQNLTLKLSESVTPTVSVDLLGVPVPNVPVRLTNVTPALVALTSGPGLTALSGTSCGPARVAASIPGSTDTLRLAINAPVTQAAVLFAGDSASGQSSGLFCANTDGTGRFPISGNGAFGAVNPRWSPDRQRVAYTFQPSGPLPQPQQLWVARWAGDTDAFVAGDAVNGAYRPRWSPNGLHLGYECGDGSSNQHVCVILDATGAIALLSQVPRIVLSDVVPTRLTGSGSFAWDPRNPDRLAFARDSLIPPLLLQTTSAIYTANVNGTGLQQLTPNPLDAGAGVLQISELDWSPAGDVMVFSATDPRFVQRLYVINRDGTGLLQLTKGPTTDSDSRPVFSPDGRQIVFLRNTGGCSIDYWRVNADGTGEQQVSDERLCDLSTAALGYDWSPDGKDIVLVGGGPDGPFFQLLVYKVAGTTTAATYFQDRRLVGRGAAPGVSVIDIQPNWRP